MLTSKELQTPAKAKSVEDINIITNKSNFAKLVKSDAFIDKTLLIKKVVNSGDNLLLTGPRRFGKSSNLNMIKTFLEIEVDEEGKEVEDKSQTKNYKLFSDLNIAQDETFMQEHCGQHPVIFVDFLNAKGSSYEEILDGVKTALHNAFMQHKYMIDVLDETSRNQNLKRSEKKGAKNALDKFERLYDNDGQGATLEDIKTGLQFLSEVLYKHFGKRAYVLVDEYDAPVHEAMHQNLKETKKVNDLIDSILCAALKGNDDRLELGVMTGVSGMVRTSAASKLNNVIQFKFLGNHQYSTYYGFTMKEIEQILDRLGLQEMKDGITNWYDGYIIQGKNLHIFSPWSVLNYLEKRELRNYWEESGAIQNIEGIFKAPDIREKMNQLTQGKELELTINTTLNMNELKSLQFILNCEDETPDQHIDLFFSYLFELGYLSHSENPGFYKIPNEEIRSESAKRMLDYYIIEKILGKKAIDNTIEKLGQLFNDASDQTSSFEEALNDLFEPIPLAEVKDPKKSGFQSNEDFYHIIIGSLAIRLVANALLRKSVTADQATPSKGKKVGFGTEVPVPYLMRRNPPQADIALVKGDIGIIFELKYKQSTRAATKQIDKNRYVDIFKEYTHLKTIKKIGINISKDKRVDIKCECELINNPSPTRSNSPSSSTGSERSNDSMSSTGSDDALGFDSPSTSVNEVKGVPEQHICTRSCKLHH